ncbi:MAG TPA: hypothetical protein VF627_12290 [Abditibacterium sp.]|jgi:hypothetical protein
MPITIENPTAQDAFAALQNLPSDELLRLKEMFAQADFGVGFRDFWTDEDLSDARAATGHLIKRRFGPEEGEYD